MYTNNKVSRAVRLALAFGTASALAVTGSVSALEADQEEQAESRVERIEVTGSRITRTDFEPTQPITTVDGEYISQRGLTNAAAAITEIPGVFAAATPIIDGNTGAASQGLGQNTINIFGLGSQRTLTLINGHRFVSSNSPVGGGSAPGSQVDVNNIPVSLIERVEVVKVGGAAVYGADAVAGVVNYVLKTDYEGAEVAVDYRSIGNSGYAEEFSIRSLVGGNFAGGRGNVVMALEYNKTDDIPAWKVPSRLDSWTLQQPALADRVLRPDGSWPANQLRLFPQPRAGILSFSGLVTPGPTAVTNIGLGSWGEAGFLQFDPMGSGNLSPYNAGTPTGNAVWASGGDGLDLIRTNSAQEGYERINVTAIANYQLADWVNLSTTVFANSSDASNPGFQALQYSSGVFGGTSRALRFNTSHPFLTDSARGQLEELLGGEGDFFLHRAWINMGAREIINESRVTSIRTGLDGEFELNNRFFNWEVSYQKGFSSVFSQDQSVSHHRWFAAMDVGINPATGAIDCRFNFEPGYGDEYRANGFGIVSPDMVLGNRGDCVPFDPFGIASQAAIDYVLIDSMGKTRIDQNILSAYISGELLELPAGMLSFAAGYENRRESGTFASSGDRVLSGFSPNATGGGYTTEDIYGEFYIPVVSPDMDVPLVHSFSVDASYRTMDNSRSGRDDAWAVGVNYRPFFDVMVRANVAKTVRAPAITELFLPVVESSQFAADPCHGANRGNGPDPETRQRNCDSQGIPADFVSLATNASRRGFTGGNDALSNEQARSFNVGLIYAPRWAEGLDLSVDYVEIDITDAIVSFTLTNIMEACYDSTDFPNQFCNRFVRGADFQLPALDAFTSGYVNAALRDFKAVEYQARYRRDVSEIPFFGNLVFGDTNAGTLTTSLRVYNLKKNATSNTGFDLSDTTGQFNNPEWRGDLKFMHEIGNLSTYLDVVYSGSGKRNIFSTEELQYIDIDGTPFTTLPSFTTYNLGAIYHLTDNITVRGRIDNVTNWYPNRRELNAGRWTWGRTFNVGMTARF